MLISMNYENSCVYLCFCCVGAVDCGVGRGELRGDELGGCAPPCGFPPTRE